MHIHTHTHIYPHVHTPEQKSNVGNKHPHDTEKPRVKQFVQDHKTSNSKS